MEYVFTYREMHIQSGRELEKILIERGLLLHLEIGYFLN